MAKNKDNIDRDDFVRLLAERGNFTSGDAKIFLKTLENIFAECIENGTNIDIRGLGHLYIQEIPARKGVNARESRLQGKTVYQEYPVAKRAIFKLAQNLRDLLREPGKRKTQDSSATRKAIAELGD